MMTWALLLCWLLLQSFVRSLVDVCRRADGCAACVRVRDAPAAAPVYGVDVRAGIVAEASAGGQSVDVVGSAMSDDVEPGTLEMPSLPLDDVAMDLLLRLQSVVHLFPSPLPRVVATLPTYFPDDTVADFQLSAQLLDINVVHAVRESVAAVHAFGFHDSLSSGHVVVALADGDSLTEFVEGHVFEATLLSVAAGNVSIVATTSGVPKTDLVTNVSWGYRITDDFDRVLADARLDKAQVNHVVLVGRSAALPELHRTAARYFAKSPNTAVHSRTAVARGAAIMGELMTRPLFDCDRDEL